MVVCSLLKLLHGLTNNIKRLDFLKIINIDKDFLSWSSLSGNNISTFYWMDAEVLGLNRIEYSGWTDHELNIELTGGK